MEEAGLSSEKELEKTVIEEFSKQEEQRLYAERALQEGAWESEKKMFRKYYKKGSSVLDIGCGAGRTTLWLCQNGYDVVGIDITPLMIKAAKQIAKKKSLRIKYEVGNAAKLRFKDERFDNALFSFNGWCQIPGHKRRQQALNEAYRVTKPGGYFIFTTHDRNVLGKRFPLWIWQAVRMYLLKPLGFNVREIDWGDRFFTAVQRGIVQYNFIHIPSRREVKQMISEAGFGLVYYAKRNDIAPADSELDSGNCTFWVCRK
jgi:ubiquinone/menaquinone biosynthesis C-methylase UbiE